MGDVIRTKRQTSYPALGSISGIEKVLVTKSGKTYNLPVELFATAAALAAKLEIVGTPEENDTIVFDGENWVPGSSLPSVNGPYGDLDIESGQMYAPVFSTWIDVTSFFLANITEKLVDTDGIKVNDPDFWRLSFDFNVSLQVSGTSAILEFKLVYNGYAVENALCKVACAEDTDVNGSFRKMIEAAPDTAIRIIMIVTPKDPLCPDFQIVFNSGSVTVDSKVMEPPIPGIYPMLVDEEGYVFIDETGYVLIDAEV